ncbi:MAG: carboxypeptidase-like regulatory domain-containing protein [Acidobacteriota bacterium]
MRKAILGGLCALALASAAPAAEIHGTVSENGKPLPRGVSLRLDCGGASASAETDSYGSYSLKIAATGDCRLSIDYKGSKPSIKVTVYEKPGRYDLVVSEKAGKFSLGRK